MSQNTLPLSVAIITLNEQRNLPRCLESVKEIAAEIVVVDSGSTDRTIEIAESNGAKVVHNPWPGHVKQKNFALDLCTQDWVLSLDADEALSDELRQALRLLFTNSGTMADGYQLNRRNNYLGAWIWHAWYPEWRVRLVRNGKARWTGRDPHDRLEVQGRVERLTGGDFLHWSYRDLEHHLQTTVKYARIGAQAYLEQGKGFRWHKLLFAPAARFFKTLILKQAWRDGWRGVLISYSSAMSVFAKYAFLLEERLKKEQSATKPK
ncbi:glycosyl transferase [Desulfocurvibacter africanus PCS]|uniref:Glycosyl transferase n=1 Tax=Desulfocurvibacter africanus PCS TaxID=1262666 RepID=M5Q329_DESAF|nr:glycosyltransferase family 2 protein [Desulfocurvibacter africanus]EMG37923.1 glycosyl transferase [Desulfocurvibacter africanus PCS]